MFRPPNKKSTICGPVVNGVIDTNWFLVPGCGSMLYSTSCSLDGRTPKAPQPASDVSTVNTLVSPAGQYSITGKSWRKEKYKFYIKIFSTPIVIDNKKISFLGV